MKIRVVQIYKDNHQIYNIQRRVLGFWCDIKKYRNITNIAAVSKIITKLNKRGKNER